MRRRSVLAAAAWGALQAGTGTLWPLPARSAGPANVLVLYSNNRLLPANIEIDRGLTEGRPDTAGNAIHFFAEFLDAPLFGGADFEAQTAAYLRLKYAARPPRVIVAVGTEALDFLLRHRDAMFAGVPMVHVGVERPIVAGRTLPADVLGTPADDYTAESLALALALHPDARRLVLVTGASAWDRERAADQRAAAAELGATLPVDAWSALPTDALQARLAALDGHTVVFTPGYFQDGAGASFAPRDAVAAMAEVSGAPIYTPHQTQLGTGIVGTRAASYADMGRAARAVVDRLLSGVPPAQVPVPARLPAPARLDWRQLRRWGIAERLLPPDAELLYRTPGFWETYRQQAIAAGAVFVLQTGLIAALLFERRRRRRTARALAASEEHLRLAGRAARLSAFAWDLRPAQPGVAPGAADAPPDAAEPLAQVLQRVHPADRQAFERALHDAAARRAELDIEFRSAQADGEPRWVAARGRVADGAPEVLRGVQLDITARKAAEAQAQADRAALTHMARVSTLGQLSAAIGHQLNQPLAAILGNAETARKLLGRGDTDAGELREILDDIVSEDQRAAEIIRRLGALYRRGETEATLLDLNALVRDTLDLLRAELTLRRVEVTAQLAAALPALPGSRVQLQQVLLNLVMNAADALADMAPPRRVIEVRTAIDDQALVVQVADRGAGIATADLGRVFEPFWSTKPTGLGVGLAICQAIVGAHGGRIRAENRVGGGAVLSFTLPLPAAE